MARKPSTTAAGIDHNAAYIKELEQKLAVLEAEKMESDPTEEISVAQTDYIKVMSLIPYRLNLCTKERGQGKIYRFDNFGQIKKIIYSDLVDILEVCQSFLEEGYFIILNPKVVRIHGLDEMYSKILTKENMEKILDGTDEGLALYTSANPIQQGIIVELVIQKLVKYPSKVDLNMIDKLSRLAGVNISQKAEDIKMAFSVNPEKE